MGRRDERRRAALVYGLLALYALVVGGVFILFAEQLADEDNTRGPRTVLQSRLMGVGMIVTPALVIGYLRWRRRRDSQSRHPEKDEHE